MPQLFLIDDLGDKPEKENLKGHEEQNQRQPAKMVGENEVPEAPENRAGGDHRGQGHEKTQRPEVEG